MTSTLIVGASGSGKSYYASTAAGKRPIFAVNCKEGDYTNPIHIPLEKALRVPKGSSVIVDDISKPKNAELADLRKLLVYSKR